MQIPLSTNYSSTTGSLRLTVPYGESVPQEIKDLVVGLNESVTYARSSGDTVDWGENRYAVNLIVRTYNSEKLGPVKIEYHPNPNNFSSLPEEAKEKLGSLTLIGKQIDYQNITDVHTIRKICINGFCIVQAEKTLT